MKTTTQLHVPDSMELTITHRMTVYEARALLAAARQAMHLSYHSTVNEFTRSLAASIEKATKAYDSTAEMPNA